MNVARTRVAIMTFGALVPGKSRYVSTRHTVHPGVSTDSATGSILGSRDTGLRAAAFGFFLYDENLNPSLLLVRARGIVEAHADVCAPGGALLETEYANA